MARRLVAGYRGHKIVKYGAIKACLACSYVESWRSTRAGFGIACPETGSLSHLIMSFLLGGAFDEDLRL
eukprot:4525942-Heterocapsa_arctica.AAC.1